MAFTLEDGTGVADANTWTSVLFADTYFAERGIVAWAGVDAVKEVALIQAADYIHGRFGMRWLPVGEQEVTAEALYTFGGTIPVQLKRAQCQYAVRALTAKLMPDPVVDENGITLVVTQKVLGPLEKKLQRVGNPMGNPQLLRNYPEADILLSSLLIPSSGRAYR